MIATFVAACATFVANHFDMKNVAQKSVIKKDIGIIMTISSSYLSFHLSAIIPN